MTTAAFSPRIITDETLLENKKHGSPAFPFQYYYENILDYDFHCIDWHWHHEIEFVQVQTGQAICFAGEEKMIIPAGRGVLINSRVIHRYESDISTMISVTVYSPYLLGDEGSMIHQKYIYPFISGGPGYIFFDSEVSSWQGTCIQHMQNVFDIQDRPDVADIKTMALLLDFWSEIHQHWQIENKKAEKTTGRLNQARLQIMMQYIQEHYRENITLDDIASAVHLGKSTAMEIFRQGIHQSPVAWLIHFRLKQAAILLSSTEKKITAIADEVGFESSTYFCRRFRKLYGMTPNEYRKAKT